MNEFQRYLAEEIAVDHADGLITRREALRRLGLLGVSTATGAALLATFARDARAAPRPAVAQAPVAEHVEEAAPVPARSISFRGPQGRTLMGAWAPARDP